MSTEISNEEFAINSTSDFMFESNDFSIETARKLVKVIYKNLGYFIRGSEESIEDKAIRARIQAFYKKGVAEGYDGDDYVNGIMGFNTCGRSIRDWVIDTSDNEELAAISFDAGRRFAEKENI